MEEKDSRIIIDINLNTVKSNYDNLRTNIKFARFCDLLLTGELEYIQKMDIPIEFWKYDGCVAIQDAIKSKNIEIFQYMLTKIKIDYISTMEYIVNNGNHNIINMFMKYNNTSSIESDYILKWYYSANKEMKQELFKLFRQQIYEFAQYLIPNHLVQNFAYLINFNKIYYLLTLEEIQCFITNYKESDLFKMSNNRLYGGISRINAYKHNRIDILKILDENNIYLTNINPLNHIYISPSLLQYSTDVKVIDYVFGNVNNTFIGWYIEHNIFKDYHSDEYIRKLLTLFSTDTIKRKEQYYYDLQVLIKKSKNKNHIKIYSDLLKENN